MNEFYLVCAWDRYYPDAGLGNILHATYDYDWAVAKKDELKASGRYDVVKLFSSNQLPWAEDVGRPVDPL